MSGVTYKFALLQALADLSVEEKTSGDGPQRLSLHRIAEKFVEYYWRQVFPFRDAFDTGTAGLLSHSAGKQAAIVKHLVDIRSRHGGSLTRARQNGVAWNRLVREVAGTVERMPLWKLQVIAGKPDEFLYRREDFAKGTITLLPGVAFCFRSFHGFISRLVRSGWISQIRGIGPNRAVLGEPDAFVALVRPAGVGGVVRPSGRTYPGSSRIFSARSV
jgi:hypothetical protein